MGDQHRSGIVSQPVSGFDDERASDNAAVADAQNALMLAMAPLAEFLASLRVLRADALFWLSWLLIPIALAGLSVAAHYEQIGSVPQQIYVGLGGGGLVMVLTPIISTASQFFPRLVFSLMIVAVLAAGSVAFMTTNVIQLASITLTVALSLCLALEVVLRRIQDALRVQQRQARAARAAVQDAVDDAERAQAETLNFALNGGAIADTLLFDAAKAERGIRQSAAAADIDLDAAAAILQRAQRLRTADPEGYARVEAWLVEETGLSKADKPGAE